MSIDLLPLTGEGCQAAARDPPDVDIAIIGIIPAPAPGTHTTLTSPTMLKTLQSHQGTQALRTPSCNFGMDT